MTPEDEEAHLVALLAGDDSSANSEDDEKVVKKDGEDTGAADEAGEITRDEADSTHGADKEKGPEEDALPGADDEKAGHDENAADQAKDTQDGGDARVDSDNEKVAVAKGTSIDNETSQPGESVKAVAKTSEEVAENSVPQFVSKVDAPTTPDLKSQTPPRNTLPLPVAATPERPPRRSVEQPRTHDPEIQELRDQLATAQRTISTQTARLGDLEEMHQRLSEQHKFLSAAKEAVEARLRDEVSKREAAEEAAESLRGQVEVARRGVMTLQKQEKERKRASMMGVPAGGIPGVGLGLNDVGEETETLDEAGAAAASSSRQLKRSSTLLRNRRSSQTELEAPHVSPNATPGATASTANAAAPAAVSPPPTNPPRSGLRELRLGANTAQMSPKLGSGAIVSSPSSQTAHLDDPYAGLIRERAVSGTSSTADHGSAIAELESVRAELLVAQVRLSESEEARQASEDCLKALREFITGSTSPAAAAEAGSDEAAVSPGIVDLNDPAALMALKGIRLPPLPTDKEPDEPAPSVPEKKGWGFKIPTWKAATGSAMQTPLSPSSQAAEPATPRTGMSPPPSIRSSSYTSHNEDGTAPVVGGGAGAPAATPLASFVSSWTRGVQPATPAAVDAGIAPTSDLPAAQATPRGFGAFFRRTNTATSNPANKDLPARPTSINETADADEVGSVGAEKDDDMDKNRLPAMSREGSNSGRMDLESRLRSQLQPSPEIKVGTLDGDTDEKEEPFKPSTSADGDLSFGTVDSDAVLNTPNMAGEPLGQGEKQGEKA